MPAVLLIMVVEALILLAVWRWDDHRHRVELQRRHVELLQTRSSPDAAAEVPLEPPAEKA